MFTRSMPNIYTRDIETAVRFYRDQLGFAQTFQFPASGPAEHVELRLGDSLVALSTLAAAVRAGVEPTSGNPFELVVVTDDVDADVARLRAVGVPVLVEPHDHESGHRLAYVADPDGVFVGLGSATTR
jgi:lactoylglutathione lyase